MIRLTNLLQLSALLINSIRSCYSHDRVSSPVYCTIISYTTPICVSSTIVLTLNYLVRTVRNIVGAGHRHGSYDPTLSVLRVLPKVKIQLQSISMKLLTYNFEILLCPHDTSFLYFRVRLCSHLNLVSLTAV